MTVAVKLYDNVRMMSGVEGAVAAIDPGDGSVFPWNETGRPVIQVDLINLVEAPEIPSLFFGDSQKDPSLVSRERILAIIS